MADLTLVKEDYRESLLRQLAKGIVAEAKDAQRAAADGAFTQALMAIEEAKRLCHCALETKRNDTFKKEQAHEHLHEESGPAA